MNEKPILFSGPMVRAILWNDGNVQLSTSNVQPPKTQTRRVMKPQPSADFLPEVGRYCPSFVDRETGEMYPGKECFGASDETQDYPCPYGQPGDRLWVKETWKPHLEGPISDEFPLGTCVKFRADGALMKPETWTVEQGFWCEAHETETKWRPSIFMPRWASRITLEIVRVRVERLQDISEDDAIAEGLHQDDLGLWTWGDYPSGSTSPRYAYQLLWEFINGPGSWALNPWVWVIEFKRI